MSASILELLVDHQPGQSEFQIDRFVVSMNGGTPFGCYRQALRELRTRFDALKDDHYQIEKAKLDLEEAEQQANELLERRAERGDTWASVEERRLDLEATRLRMLIETLHAIAKDRARELAHVLGLVRGYRRMLGAPLTRERREEYEREQWVHAIKCAAAAHYISLAPNQPAALPSQVAAMIQALPPEMRLGVCQTVASAPAGRAALLGWWLDYAATVPEVEPVSEEEVRSLVWLTPSPQPSSG